MPGAGLFKQAGIKFSVFERDEAPTSRLQGYQLSMTPDGLQALHANLPADLWDRVDKACTRRIEGISFVSPQLEQKFFKKTSPETDHVHRFSSISRITLRKILLTGLVDQVTFGIRFTHYELLPEGLRCHFEHGRTRTDTCSSAVTECSRWFAISCCPRRTRCIAGQISLDEQTKSDFFPPPIGQSAVVIDTLPQRMFLASHELNAGKGDQDYIFWSFLTKRSRFPEDLETKTPEALVELTQLMTSKWHPRLRSLVARADPKTVLPLRYRASTRPERWPAGIVTLLGDAIHNMPPTGGEGANMALRDAEVLCSALRSSQDGHHPLGSALTEYENQMLQYAFKAVDTSIVNLHRMVMRKT